MTPKKFDIYINKNSGYMLDLGEEALRETIIGKRLSD